MTNAGWYPDPAGTPGSYRYWDGRSWSEQTSTNPYGTSGSQPYGASGPAAPPDPPAGPPSPPDPPAGPPSPPTGPPAYGQQNQPGQPSPYGQPGQPGQPAPPSQPAVSSYGAITPPPPPGGPGQPWNQGAPSGSGGSGKGKVIGLAVGAVAVLVVLAVVAFLLVRTVTSADDDPTARADSSSSSSESGDSSGSPSDGGSSDAPTDGGTVTPTTEQCSGGQPTPGSQKGGFIRGGGLKMPTLADEGYAITQTYSEAFTFAERFSTISKVIEEGSASGGGWVSTGGVGGLLKRNGFDSPEQAAPILMQCIAANPSLYSGITGVTELSSGAVQVDGHDAYQITSELRIEDPQIEAEGDQVQVVVVDTGDDRTFGVYLFAVPIGDQDLIGVQKDLLGQVTVP